MDFSIFKDRRGTSQSAAQLRVDRTSTAAIDVSHGGTPYAAATANSTRSEHPPPQPAGPAARNCHLSPANHKHPLLLTIIGRHVQYITRHKGMFDTTSLFLKKT